MKMPPQKMNNKDNNQKGFITSYANRYIQYLTTSFGTFHFFHYVCSHATSNKTHLNLP